MRPLYVHEEVIAIHGSRCPCCSRVMRVPREGQGRLHKDHRTRGHDRPAAQGGRLWVYICHACNQAQRALTFRQWAQQLAHFRDARAAAVFALAQLLDDHRAAMTSRRMSRQISELALALHAVKPSEEWR